MKQKCEYCDTLLEDTQERCPNCGAPNNGYKRESSNTPKTIEDLQNWYEAHHLPPSEVTRFFIGIDCREAKAYGIYRQGDRFIVYKNKADGSRAVRYDGADEAYAVNEIYLKLKDMISQQKARQNTAPARSAAPAKNSRKTFWIALVIVFMLMGIIGQIGSTSRGYYSYGGSTYYYLDNDWYVYSYGHWIPTVVDSDLSDNSSDYFESSYYSSSYGTSNFEDTSYYSDWKDSSWDSDSDWDSGSDWDSDFGDWDSDW